MSTEGNVPRNAFFDVTKPTETDESGSLEPSPCPVERRTGPQGQGLRASERSQARAVWSHCIGLAERAQPRLELYGWKPIAQWPARRGAHVARRSGPSSLEECPETASVVPRPGGVLECSELGSMSRRVEKPMEWRG
jgi:hypothetical protein